jgi:PKD repeat protein
MTKNFFILAILSIIIFAAITPINIVLSQTPKYPTVLVQIYRIQGIDSIESILEGQPDWHYYLSVWDGEQWLSEEDTIAGNDVIVDEFYWFTVETVAPTIEIWLMEDDFISASDAADISSYDGGGPDNWGSPPPPRGAYYRATYDLISDELDGDTIVLESGYWKTSGDYDGSVTTDENDANLWFWVEDNYEHPTAKAGSDQVCYTREKVNFDGSYSSASDGSSIEKYEWDFDDDGVVDVEGAKSSFTFEQKGTYNVKLTVTDSLGQKDTDYCVVTVQNRVPETSFTYTPTEMTIKDAISFFDTSQDQDGTIVAWYWDFGDGTNSTLRNPTHTFSQKGNHDVALTVTDNDGAKDLITHRIVVMNLPPEALFEYTPEDPHTNIEIQFTDKSTDPEDIPISSLFWDFGDGYTSELQNPTHKFTSKGNYNVTLTIWDDENATDTFSMIISVAEPPPSQVAVPVPLWVIALVIIILVASISSAYFWNRHRRRTST